MVGAWQSLLLIDQWAMAPLSDSERPAFLKICDERYQTKATGNDEYCLRVPDDL